MKSDDCESCKSWSWSDCQGCTPTSRGKVRISGDDADFMLALAERLRRDDVIASERFGEAQPVMYLITETESVPAPKGWHDQIYFCYQGNYEWRVLVYAIEDYIFNPETRENATSWRRYDELDAVISPDDVHIGNRDEYLLIDFAEDVMEDDGCVMYGQNISKFSPICMFLTYEDAKKYLEENYYHHSSNAHIYCSTAWRNPTVDRLWKILRGIGLHDESITGGTKCLNESTSNDFICSLCGCRYLPVQIAGKQHPNGADWNYCPNCGAKVVDGNAG